MGMLIDGKWQDEVVNPNQQDGEFRRLESSFRSWIKKDGSTEFKPEKNRYHLYISHACPWAHRTLIFRRLKGLEDYISLSVVSPYMHKEGWSFDKNFEGVIEDSENGAKFLREIYTKADPSCTSKVTVPVLWDKKRQTIVNNESSEIIRMFNSEFNDLTDNDLDFYPEEYKDEIDAINDFIYNNINNGVYKVGFASTQNAYDKNCKALFEALDRVDEILSLTKYLVGNIMTEADWRLFTTLIRFDAVYVGHFKCNIKRIADYKNLHRYLLDLYNYPGIKELVNLPHIKTHYYGSHLNINPTGIVPAGPNLNDWP